MLSLRILWDHQSLFHNARELTYLYCRAKVFTCRLHRLETLYNEFLCKKQ